MEQKLDQILELLKEQQKEIKSLKMIISQQYGIDPKQCCVECEYNFGALFIHNQCEVCKQVLCESCGLYWGTGYSGKSFQICSSRCEDQLKYGHY